MATKKPGPSATTAPGSVADCGSNAAGSKAIGKGTQGSRRLAWAERICRQPMESARNEERDRPQQLSQSSGPDHAAPVVGSVGYVVRRVRPAGGLPEHDGTEVSGRHDPLEERADTEAGSMARSSTGQGVDQLQRPAAGPAGDPADGRVGEGATGLLAKWRLVQAILLDPVSAFAKVVAARLLDHRNSKTGRCNPKLMTLARDLRHSTRAITRAIHELEHVGRLTVSRGWGRRNGYVFPDLAGKVVGERPPKNVPTQPPKNVRLDRTKMSGQRPDKNRSEERRVGK